MKFIQLWRKILPCLLLFPCALYAQSIKKPKRSHGYVNPKIVGMGETKGISLQYERLMSSSIYTPSSSSYIDENERIEFKLKAPLVLKPGLKLALGFAYKSEELEFETTDSPASLYFDALTEKPLKSIEGKFQGIKPTKGNHYYLFQASVKFSGDYETDQLPVEMCLRPALDSRPISI